MNKMSGKPIISIIAPCFNEEEVLPKTAETLASRLRQLKNEQIIDEKSSVLFVDDGSTDNTWQVIRKIHEENPEIFTGIKLSANTGQQNALFCGLLAVKDRADAAVTMDADLQDDTDTIDQMIGKFINGCEIVYGVRSNRGTDGLFKRASAGAFYRFTRLLGIDLVYNHADFRLLGAKALAALAEYNEVNLFLRGIVPMLGFKTDTVYYCRKKRAAGKSKYPLTKMLKFAFEGITSFSVKPMRLITLLGVLVITASVAMIVYFIIRYFGGRTVTGWASVACSIWGIGGLILFSIGVIGEYIGKIYLETKRRPRYHIEQCLSADKSARNPNSADSLFQTGKVNDN